MSVMEANGQANRPLNDLVERSARGDRGAAEDLFERHRLRLKESVESWSRFRLGPPIESEEVIQGTFAIALGSIGRFEPRGEDSFFLWLCGIAKRVLQKLGREAQRAGGPQAGSSIPASGVSPSRSLRREERLERLLAAIESLPPDNRTAIHLARIDGLKVEEIARRMGRSRDAVKHLLARGLRELRRRFGDTESLSLPPPGIPENGEGHGD